MLDTSWVCRIGWCCVAFTGCTYLDVDCHNVQYFGPGKKILGQVHRILVLFYISFEVTPSSARSLGVPTYHAHLVHQTSLDVKTQKPDLKNPESIINISASRPTFTVRFLSFIRSLSEISINPLFRVPGGLGRRRVAECHRNVIIRPPETFTGWKSQWVSIECIRRGSGWSLLLHVGYMKQSVCFIPHYTPSLSWSLEHETQISERQNSEKQNFKQLPITVTLS